MNRERGRPQLRFGEQLLILLEKEWLQMVRDPAVIFMGALLPVVLIVLFGWGLSMDLLKVPAVFTAGESTALTAEVRAAFRGMFGPSGERKAPEAFLERQCGRVRAR